MVSEFPPAPVKAFLSVMQLSCASKPFPREVAPQNPFEHFKTWRPFNHCQKRLKATLSLIFNRWGQCSCSGKPFPGAMASTSPNASKNSLVVDNQLLDGCCLFWEAFSQERWPPKPSDHRLKRLKIVFVIDFQCYMQLKCSGEPLPGFGGHNSEHIQSVTENARLIFYC